MKGGHTLGYGPPCRDFQLLTISSGQKIHLNTWLVYPKADAFVIRDFVPLTFLFPTSGDQKILDPFPQKYPNYQLTVVENDLFGKILG